MAPRPLPLPCSGLRDHPRPRRVLNTRAGKGGAPRRDRPYGRVLPLAARRPVHVPRYDRTDRVVRVDNKRNVAVASLGLGQWEVGLDEVFMPKPGYAPANPGVVARSAWSR